jgi:hypothetical protein
MNLLTDAMSGLGAVLLPIATGLLLEELTLGGLVRLVLAPRPKTRRRGVRREWELSAKHGCGEPNEKSKFGGTKCLH